MAKKGSEKESETVRNNVTEENTTTSESVFDDPKFWFKQIDAAIGCEVRRDWIKVAETVTTLVSRRIGKQENQKTDPLDATASLAWSMIGELIYHDPRPEVSAWRSSAEPIAPTWAKLLEYCLTGDELLHQTNSLMFMCRGLAGIKILPAGHTVKYYRIDAQNIIYNKEFYKIGGDPFKYANMITERIPKRASDIRRNRNYDKATREALATRIAREQKLPEEMAWTEIFEVNARDKNGKWQVRTVHRDANSVLQKGKNPIGTPPLALLQQPGPYGVECGILSRISKLDEENNKVYKRSLERTTQRSDIVLTKKSVTQRGASVPGKGMGKSKAERAFQAGKKGIATLECDDDVNNAIKHITVGQMTEDDMKEIVFNRSQMQWQLGTTTQSLSGPEGEKTATEVQFVAAMQKRRASVVERLVDSYFDRLAYVTALTLLWMVRKAQTNPAYLDLFAYALPNAEEYINFVTVAPNFSDDLSEFKIGIEPGSTRQMRDQFIVEVFDRLLSMIEPLNAVAGAGGKYIDLVPLLKPFLRALDLPIDIDEILKEIPPEVLAARQGGERAGEQMGAENGNILESESYSGGQTPGLYEMLQAAGVGNV